MGLRLSRKLSTRAARSKDGERAAAIANSNLRPVTRTSSEPLTPTSKEPKYLNFDEDFNVYEKRGSIASVQDDPFFRNYQSPHSVSLAKELRSANNSDLFRHDDILNEPPPRSPERPSVDSTVKLPVCAPPLNNWHKN